MFKNLGKIKYKTYTNIVQIDLKYLKDDVNFTEEFIIYKNKNNLSIYDRVCDHNSGKLISRNNKTFCPMHNWEFLPKKGCYTNGLKKNKKSFEIKNGKICVQESKFEPHIEFFDKDTDVKVRYINHAFLIVESENFKFATDPWALGPAFNTGWWLKHKTIDNWVDELNSCDFIYISHNHPDHCHELTLSYINKDIPIIVPDFVTNSTGLLIEDLGFKNINNMVFENQYQFRDTDLIFTIFKSGDLREDSGIYFSVGKFKCLLTVDANNLNFLRLPKVDLFASSFAGGAHGYPLNCENYELKDRKKMILMDKNFIKQTKFKYLEKIKPTYFLPYAGFFKEKLKRDEMYIKYNKKNETEDYISICEKYNINLLDPEKENIFEFLGNKPFRSSKYSGKFFTDLSSDEYLKYFTNKYQKIDLDYIEKYFLNSYFHDGSKLYISLTNDEFKTLGLDFKIEFSKDIKFEIINENFQDRVNKDYNYLYLKIRKEAFLNTIYNKRSWEDISIGFQNRQFRNPNRYNNNFWHHFSNKYVSKKFVKSVTDCSNCVVLNQDIHNMLFKNEDRDTVNRNLEK